MGVNFHSSWSTATLFKPADMNAPLESLDKAISYTKNIMITCTGSITYDSTAHTITWDAPLKIIMIDEGSGKMHINKVSSGALSLSTVPGDVVYAAITTVFDDTVAATFVAFSSASTALQPSSIIVIGMVDTTDAASFFGSPALMPALGALT